ncbi:cytochrome P450, partial [Tanacetum coccineum]
MTPSLLWNFHRFHDHLTDILKQNGGTFMFKGPWFTNNDMLFTSDPANFQYITATNYHNYPKGPEHREFFDIIGDGIFNCDSQLWNLQRKTTMSLLNHAEFKKLVDKTMWNGMHKKLIPVLDYMTEKGLKTDLQNIFQRLTFDVTMDSVLDYDPETLSVDLPYNAFDVAITKSEETIFYRHFLPKFYWKFMNRLQIGKEKHLIDTSNLSDEVFYKFIQKKQKKLLNVDSFEKEQLEDVRLVTGFLREYKDKPCKFIKDTLLTMLIAGRDTTSSSLTWFFYLLAKNPIVEGKIYQEIHARLGMKEGDKWKTFGKKELEMLVYLHGALCETLRLFPPGPANPRSPQEADTLPSGRQVHTHTRIVLHPYAMRRMETIWGPDCLEFRPERWISEQGGIKHMPS